MSSKNGSIFITGANGGLGSAMISAIVSNPDFASSYHGIYTVRQLDRASNLTSVLENAPKKRHSYETLALDLARIASVRDVAHDINTRVASGELPPIRALILNAAYQEHTTQGFTPDGFDMSFQCNYLSHWLLVLMLLQSMDKEHGRIVVIGSWSHDSAECSLKTDSGASPFDPRNNSMRAYVKPQWKTIFHDADSLAKGTWSSAKDYPISEGGYRRYGAGKLCEIMMMYELQRRLDADPALSRVVVLGVDPGGMASGLTRRGSTLLVFAVQYLFPLVTGITTRLWPNGTLRSIKKSAGDVLRAAFDTEELGEQPKAVYMNGSERGDTSIESKDAVKCQQLWRASIKYVALGPEDTILFDWK
ncbi:Protochlorophyllide reductase B, chloroplastic [Cytospora mali]|uniref:3beta-hydroxysteroid 3-dehydrogenase n=1 Tax=Cytospora mali TaxID=578113 RepID=A0A194VFV5_CYTMA|nr:Protochlorophyllide reductase B, chloroplastic [Valsa mali var. pyri (nom. inval.)]